MFLSKPQQARIDSYLQALGARGVSVFGSSGDGLCVARFQTTRNTEVKMVEVGQGRKKRKESRESGGIAASLCKSKRCHRAHNWPGGSHFSFEHFSSDAAIAKTLNEVPSCSEMGGGGEGREGGGGGGSNNTQKEEGG